MFSHRKLTYTAFLAALTALVSLTTALFAQYPTEGPVSGYSQGSQLDRRPMVPVPAYSASTYVPGYYGSLYGPIMMTTINTPGIYGAYSYGVAPLTFNREPTFYPAENPRATIPAITTTMPPMKPADGQFNTAVPTMAVSPVEPKRGLTARMPGEPLSSNRNPEAPAGTAKIRVHVPADAQVYFEGVLTAPKGENRTFVSPPLADGREYRYDIKAVYNVNGKPVTADRHILVRAGDRLDVDFLQSPTLKPGEATLKTAPASLEQRAPAPASETYR